MYFTVSLSRMNCCLLTNLNASGTKAGSIRVSVRGGIKTEDSCTRCLPTCGCAAARLQVSLESGAGAARSSDSMVSGMLQVFVAGLQNPSPPAWAVHVVRTERGVLQGSVFELLLFTS